MAQGTLNAVQTLQAVIGLDVYTKAETNALLDLKADKSTTYTKTETDALLSEKANADSVYTKAEADALLDEKADADAVYTKTETDTLLSAKADKSTTLAGYGITDAYTKTQTDTLLNGKADADDVYTKSEIDTKIPSSVGSATKPVYVNGGVVSACTYELNKTVPANAVFTDTTYTAGNGLNLSGTSFSAKAGTNVTVDGNGINVNGSGAVASANSGLVSGGTAYTELRPTLDGTWVKQAQTTAINLQKLEGGIEYLYAILSKQYDQLKKYINGNYYDYDTDNNSKYVKNIPQGAMPYASLDSIGGKTVVWNQLVQNGNFADASGWTATGLTVSNNVATISNATTSYVQIRLTTSFNAYAGHKYFISADISSSTSNGAFLPNGGSTSSSGNLLDSTSVKHCSYIYTPSANESFNMATRFSVTTSGVSETVTATISNYICVDMTLMFGSGNEPTTVAEFQQMFPASYYSYNAGQLLSAGVTEVVSKKADTTTLATYPIPDEVQALEGYGWSAGSVYNYIDFERKVFVQNVMSVVLDGTQATGAYSFASPQCRCSYKVTGIETTTDTANVDNKIVSSYLPNGSNTDSQNGVPCVFRRGNGSAEIFVSLGSIGISAGVTDVTSFNTYMSNRPLTVYVAMATPIETDISRYLTDDNLIEVESGGTLSFPNQHGDDYRIDVPSSETYMVDLQASLGG